MTWDLPKLAELIAIIAGVNGMTVWVIKRLLENQRDAFMEQVRGLINHDREQDNQIAEVKTELSEFKIETTRSFIHREDAIIYFGRFEQKLDAVWDHLMRMPRQPGGSNGP